MTDLVRFMLFGLGDAAVYALLASGAVVIYRGSGVVNFAQGSFALVGGYTYYELRDLPPWISVPAAIVVCALGGLLVEYAVMWPMRRSSPLARVIATLGIVAVLSQAAQVIYGDTLRLVESVLPTDSFQLTGSIVLSQERLWMFVIAVVLIGLLWVVYRRTRFGLATSAAGENQDALAGQGWSPRAVAGANWAIGCGLAGLAGVLFVPSGGLDQNVLTLAIVPTLSAALVGGFASFPLTLVGAMIIGVLQSETTRWISTPGWNVAVPFLVIVFMLVIRGKAIPIRSFLADRLPAVGSGRVRPLWLIVAVGGSIGVLFAGPSGWADAVTLTAIISVLCLSVVLLTGYAGQISLAQYALAGIGALISSRFADALGVPFVLALLLAVALSVPIGMIVALPALRARGVNLAVATLGVSAVLESVVLANVDYTGGPLGTNVDPPTLFGLDINAVEYPHRYAIVCIVLATAVALVVSNIRRGRAGRQLLAVRDNERAAASVGVAATTAKVYAFGVAAAMAALGGVLLAFRNQHVDFSGYNAITSINIVVLTVIGGVGYVFGGVTGGILITAGAVEWLIRRGVDLSSEWQLFLGLFLLVQIIHAANGIAHVQVELIAKLRAWLEPRLPWRAAPGPATGSDAGGGAAATRTAVSVTPQTLELRGVTVYFGGNRALNDLTLVVNPGEVVGLIGPNGAGKTTLIDVATGFVRPSAGEVLLGGRPLRKLSPSGRARAGLTRSWQSLELFSVMSVEENLRTAAEECHTRHYLRDMIWPRREPLPPVAQACIAQFDLADVLDRSPEQLPYAIRRLVGIARAASLGPSVLLLDEPAAGLDDTSTARLSVLVRQLAKEWGMGILLIEHDVSMVMNTCDRVMALAFGAEITTGTPNAVRSHPEVISSYLGASAGGGTAPRVQTGAGRSLPSTVVEGS
ncbi:ABC transporter permease subunit [Dactylosporangium sp. CA-092794]|uniref:ABC transporter permease subunit n=1 Tax=Dactylosporangium sp. CA-092794 TaxID=3239929 RepID=UPI003D8D8C28